MATCTHCGVTYPDDNQCQKCPQMLEVAKANGFEGNVMEALRAAREGELPPPQVRQAGNNELLRLVGDPE